ncbi:MAG: ACP phosphodiesterase [Spirosomataceae bacterium]
MNYLAHLALSGDEPDVLIGNFMGDFIKGQLTHNRFTSLPVGIQKGILLHRKIDNFTDTHPFVSEVAAYFAPSQGKFASIVTDVLFDYLLANHWDKLYTRSVDLDTFAENIYTILPKYTSFYPERMEKVVQSLLLHKWLPQYKSEEGIQMALAGISRRLTLKPSFESVFSVFRANEQEITSLFLCYYPQLQEFCTEYLMNEFIPYESKNT